LKIQANYSKQEIFPANAGFVQDEFIATSRTVFKNKTSVKRFNDDFERVISDCLEVPKGKLKRIASALKSTYFPLD
jgi:hypothetical protein